MLAGRNYLRDFYLLLQLQKNPLIARKPPWILRFTFAEMVNWIAENAPWRKSIIGAPTLTRPSFHLNPLWTLRFIVGANPGIIGADRAKLHSYRQGFAASLPKNFTRRQWQNSTHIGRCVPPSLISSLCRSQDPNCRVFKTWGQPAPSHRCDSRSAPPAPA